MARPIQLSDLILPALCLQSLVEKEVGGWVWGGRLGGGGGMEEGEKKRGWRDGSRQWSWQVQVIPHSQSAPLRPAFIVYATMVVIVAVFLIIHTAPRYGNKNVLVYITICSSLGSFTVMGCKGVGVGLKQTLRGHNQFTNWMFYVLLFVVVACILIQLNYLNRALDTFNTAVVTPIYYVFFTSLVMVASLILFKEWGTMKIEDILGDLCGFLTIIVGIFLLNAFKDFNISLRTLPGLRKDQSDSSDNNNFLTPCDDHAVLLENGQLEAIHAEVMVTDYHDSPEEVHA